ncbi:hypothetical protein Cgig2_018647 [Carnegiea gigantea]|uniref:Uncharacterized protein n=1 Tax=Carnegiea gigantea TaxID=171969 RepID=A0A9Q1KDY1_9CARY|nr:hypothetical protein Cgig2_018647 [Carnegiea gigantea]
MQKSSKQLHKVSGFGLKEVKDTFTDVDDYLSTFEPLLFEEVKAQIVQAKDEDEGTSVMEQKVCVVKECSDSDGFYFPVVIYDADEGESVSQNDLLLLSREKIDLAVKKLPSAYAFALVEHRQGASLRLRMFLDGEVKGTNIHERQPTPRLDNIRLRLCDSNILWYGSKVISFTQIFVCLQCFNIFDVCGTHYADEVFLWRM